MEENSTWELVPHMKVENERVLPAGTLVIVQVS